MRLGLAIGASDPGGEGDRLAGAFRARLGQRDVVIADPHQRAACRDAPDCLAGYRAGRNEIPGLIGDPLGEDAMPGKFVAVAIVRTHQFHAPLAGDQGGLDAPLVGQVRRVAAHDALDQIVR